MAHYVIGDVQGCYASLRALLDLVDFSISRDKVWFAGDLVNRGPDSLATLRHIFRMGSSADSVLGNHDLHLLAAFHGHARANPKDRLDRMLNAADRQELIDWLSSRPMLLESPSHQVVLTHAGIPPCWSLSDARRYAAEVESVLRGDLRDKLLRKLYGNQPDCWHEDLQGMPRIRAIINYLTRMRICTAMGKLEFHHKTGLTDMPEGYAPWFSWPHQDWENQHLIFGHWSTLEPGHTPLQVHALDTGCVWGGSLTALELNAMQLYSLPCQLGGEPA
ncbi:MAG: symmetrical bis(5'-nucleosyl)-tetraphosphatase [Pseudomonadales bacterium]|nr:symmetrical bis(5'-nucleosyl)-tetraphosphatase [Pseudomonadales bacterium]